MPKDIGIIRRLDELGRIVIPIEIRNKLNIKVKDEMEIFLERGCIMLKKYEPYCIFCGNDKDLEKYKEKFICQDCIKKVKIGKS